MNAGLRGGTAALAAALLAAGCATAPGTAELVGYRYYRTPIDTYPVTVTAVDGKGTPLHGRLFVEPGRRELVVQGPPTLGSRYEEARFTLDAKPCTRYYLVAVKPSPLLSSFRVQVDYEEPLAICTPTAAG
ncbi:MAG TPA: hypothetical protein VLI72_05640 [Methylibium sp.]|nr:hypothetical protein [Methylibium sp.]